MEDELEIVKLTMDIFEKMRQQETSSALRNWLRILPDNMLSGSAMQLLRQYAKQNPTTTALSSEEKTALAGKTAMLIINDLLQKERQVIRGAKKNEDLDGAELFYRRALSHMAMERYSDAERFLKRAVEICPSFVDGWEAFVEVLERNGKDEHAAEARTRLAQLRQS
jgi:tetratricopeptide (TPR) repeat protein